MVDEKLVDRGNVPKAVWNHYLQIVSRSAIATVLIVLMTFVGRAAAAQVYQNEPFNLAVPSLPANFLGADLLAVHAELKERTELKKGEFETAAQFAKRAEQEAGNNTKVIGSLLTTSVYAFSTTIRPRASQYDADRSVLDFAATVASQQSAIRRKRITMLPVNDLLGQTETRGGILFLDHTYHAQIWQKTSTPMTSYVASNAFGTTVKVEKQEEYEIGLLWCTRGPVYDCTASVPTQPFQIKLGVDEAKAAKEVARFLVIGRLTQAVRKGHYVIETEYHRTPEIRYPYDTITHTSVIQFVASDLWLYNGTTGKVYLKLKLPTML